jgi:K+-transporting ATPase ATPase C chain
VFEPPTAVRFDTSRRQRRIAFGELFMLAHLRPCLWLLGLTLVLCSVLYPLSLWLVGQIALSSQANGSLVYDQDKPVGSWLIAQKFEKDEYFQPRPSATSGDAYNAAASGASNWGANNYQLRDRVARALATVAKYKSGPKKGQLVKNDVVVWFRNERPGAVAEWAEAHSTLAENWATADEAAGKYIEEWFAQRPALLAQWKKNNPKKPEPTAKDLAPDFFKSFSKTYPATWLSVVEKKNDKGETIKDNKGNPVKEVKLVPKDAEDSADIASVFFDLWLSEHNDSELMELVPVDMVTASGSGLDPHITLASAVYQIPRVASAQTDRLLQDRKMVVDKVRRARIEMEFKQRLDDLVKDHARSPLLGLAGVPMVNVLEINLELPALREKIGEALP